jgi:hypothetical protein
VETTHIHALVHTFARATRQAYHVLPSTDMLLIVMLLSLASQPHFRPSSIILVPLHLAKLDSMKTAMAYIEALKTASLDDECSKLDADALYQL